jgi:hypothetical protein
MRVTRQPTPHGFMVRKFQRTILSTPRPDPDFSFLVFRRHMFLYGGMPAPDQVAEMACHPLIAIETFHGCPGVADFQLLFYQGVGDGEIMPFHLHMIIEMDHCLFPVSYFILKVG